jgi:hypothetical protein
MIQSVRTQCMAALKFSDGSIEWNGMRYADEEALYEAVDSICGKNPKNPLVIIEKCGNREKITSIRMLRLLKSATSFSSPRDM